MNLLQVISAILRARALSALAFIAWLCLLIYSGEAIVDCVPDWISGRGCDFREVIHQQQETTL